METFPSSTVHISGPEFHVDLPPIDARHPEHYSRRLLFFRCSSSTTRDAQRTELTHGLKRLVQICPILGGVVVPLPDQVGCHTVISGPGISLITRDLCDSMPSLEELERTNFSPSELPWDQLMPIPKDSAGVGFPPALAVQFSSITGGTILTFAMSHRVADGVGMDVWMKALGDEMSGKSTLIEPRLGEDRRALRRMTSNIPFDIEDHPGYRYKPPDVEETPISLAGHSFSTTGHPFSAENPQVPVLLHISLDGLAELKVSATSENNIPPISTHDALVALIWRTTILLRSRRHPSLSISIPPVTTSYLFMPSDARKHLGLNKDYVGNAVYQLAAKLPLGTLFGPDGLQHAARAIRTTITNVNPDLVGSYFAESKTNTTLEWQFPNGTVGNVGVAMGTDFHSGTAMYSDWGGALGPVVRYRQIGEAATYVLPRRPDGGAEVVIAVMRGEEAVLKGEERFGQYLA